MTVENYLKITKSEEAIGGGTGLGEAYQQQTEVGGYLWVGMDQEDWLQWLALYHKKEMPLEDWICQELGDWNLGVKPTQVCMDSAPRLKDGAVEFQVSVEDWE